MNWNDTVNARGWKVPFVGKSLFQIGKELLPKIDAIIMRRSLVPDQPVMDKAFFTWMPALEAHWPEIRDLSLGHRHARSVAFASRRHGRRRGFSA